MNGCATAGTPLVRDAGDPEEAAQVVAVPHSQVGETESEAGRNLAHLVLVVPHQWRIAVLAVIEVHGVEVAGMGLTDRGVEAKPGHALTEQSVDAMAMVGGLVRESLSLPGKEARLREPLQPALDMRALDPGHGQHAAGQLAV